MTQTSTQTTHPALLVIPPKPNAPIACDMTTAPDTAEERFAEYGRLFAHALVARERTSDGVMFKFAAKAGVAEWVSDLARREAACCPFFAYHISFEPDAVTWRTSGDASQAVQSFLDEFHGLPERIAEGFDGLIERLGSRGVSISTSAPGRYTLDERPPAPGMLAKLKSVCGC